MLFHQKMKVNKSNYFFQYFSYDIARYLQKMPYNISVKNQNKLITLFSRVFRFSVKKIAAEFYNSKYFSKMSQGGRQFYTFHGDQPEDTTKEISENNNFEDICQLIRNNLIGNDLSFQGPFGRRQVLYCDYIASGKSLKFIEDFIRDEVLPHYGNTHTTTSVTSLQTSMYRHEARDILRNAVYASEHDSVIFVGSGCTGAVHRLINGLNLKKSQKEIVVFVSQQEHHSNLLPWRELGL